jgi:hypothetical protein
MEQKVIKIMSEATLRFAKSEGVDPSKIGFIIHTKDENYSPKYWLMVDGKIKKDEEGKNLELRFTRDILNKLFDPVTPSIVSNFMSMKFDYYTQVHADKNVLAQNLYFVLKPNSSIADDFTVAVTHTANGKTERLEFLKLESLFQVS